MSVSRFCPNCGRPVPPENSFCAGCGFALGPSGTPSAPGGTPPPPAAGPGAVPPPPMGYPPGYAPPMYAMPARVGAGSLLSDTFDVWIKNFGVFFLVYLVLSLVTGGLGLLGAYLILGVLYVGGTIPLVSAPTAAGILAILAYAFFVAIVGWVLSSIVLGGVVDFSVRRDRGENVRIMDSLSKGLQRVLSILGANLLVTLITVGVLLLWAGLLFIGVFALVATGGGAAGLAAICGALIALPFIGVLVLYIDLGLCLYAPVIMVEGAHAVDSLSRSWTLTKGHKWSILGAGLVLFILAAIIGGAISIAGSVSGNAFVELATTAIASAITGAWITILTAVAYTRIVRQPRPSAWPPAYMPPVYPPR